MKLLFALLTILTTYSQGVYHSECEVECEVGAQRTNSVVDELIVDLQTAPERLSDWAFVGLGHQKDAKKDAFYLEWKKAEYDPEKHYSRIVMDVLVNNRPMFRDVVIESIVTDSVHRSGQRDVRVDIFYSGSLLKEAYGTFHIVPLAETKSKMTMDIYVRFGWFFNIFVSQRVYRNVVDWRIERFLQNIKEMAETGKVTIEENDK